jgi:hypothetical protein
MHEWWARLFFRSRMRAELTREMAAHLEAKTAALLEEGLSPEEASRRARIEFGNTPLLAERSAEIWRWPRLESTWADLKLALHKLRKSPGYAVVAILTMVIGIGASTTIFTILDAVMLRSLPVQRPSELVSFGIKSPHAAARRDWYSSAACGSSSRPLAQLQRPEWLGRFHGCGA